MSHFIKLSNVIINTKFMSAILIEPKLYTIYIVNNNISGFMLASFGIISSNDTKIQICKEKNLDDYNIISNWIKFTHNDK